MRVIRELDHGFAVRVTRDREAKITLDFHSTYNGAAALTYGLYIYVCISILNCLCVCVCVGNRVSVCWMRLDARRLNNTISRAGRVGYWVNHPWHDVII